MNDKDIFESVSHDLTDRANWANRQTVFYQLRHDGLRRRRKPFPGAADLHFPLVDQTIEKLKPFYYNQIFATELLASFVAKPGADKAAITAAAEWFDYKLKERSNFEDEILLAMDAMLQSGRGPLKIAWDAAGKRLRFEAVEPIYFIVPTHCAELAETDRATHVQHLPVWQYKNGPLKDRLNQDPDFIKRITGRGTTRDGEAAQLDQERASREGLTYPLIRHGDAEKRGQPCRPGRPGRKSNDHISRRKLLMNSQTKDLVITAGTPAEETPASSQKAKVPAYDRMNVLCVPIEALGMDSEDGGDSTQPEIGDEVEVSVTGLVNRIQDGQAYIVVASVNDTPVTRQQPNGTAYQIRSDQVVFDPDRFGIGRSLGSSVERPRKPQPNAHEWGWPDHKAASGPLAITKMRPGPGPRPQQLRAAMRAGPRSKVQGPRSKVQSPKSRVPGSGFRVPGSARQRFGFAR
jgi:hypothetical protein